MSSADRRSLFILLAALAGAFLLGAAVHPGTARSGRGEAEAPALRLDATGQVLGARADVHVTADGRRPDAGSPVLRDARLPGGGAEALLVIPTSPQWRHPLGSFPEGRVVRAVQLDDRGRPGAETVCAAVPDEHPGLPVLALVVDPGALFDADSGIYVPGNAIWDQRAEFVRRYPDDQRWWKYPGNYHYRGEEAERHGRLFWFAPGGQGRFRTDPAWSADVSLRINGNNTRGFPQHALRIIFPEPLSEPLFGEARGEGFHRVLLRTSGNDQDRTFFRDALQHRLCADEPFGTSACVQTVLYVNGAYWGLHNLRERLDRKELARRLGVKPKRITILADRLELYEGDSAERKAFARFLTRSERWEPNGDAFIDSLERYMDVDEFMRYMSAQIIFGNTDWPEQNGKWYRYTGRPDSVPGPRDGRWHFLMGDSDLSFGLTVGPAFDMFAHVDRHASAPLSRLLRACLRSPALQDRFMRIVLAQLDGPLSADRMVAEAMEMRAVIDSEMHRHTRRWRRPVDHAAWSGHVDALLTFARERGHHVREQLVKHFPTTSGR